jgi:predicted CoA-binding protein
LIPLKAISKEMLLKREILESATTIATVGASTDGSKPAGEVPRYLKQIGFRVIPVNPSAIELFGEKAYPSLLDIGEPVDVVQVFRPADEAPEIARQAAQIGAKALWLQLGIRSDEARRIAEEAGLVYVEDRCMAVESRRLGITKTRAA